MDIYIFCDLLYNEMIKIGIPELKATKYIDNLRKNLAADDIANVKENDIPKYARICADNILGNDTANKTVHEDTNESVANSSNTEPSVMDTDNAPTIEIKKPKTVILPEDEAVPEPNYEEPLPKATPKYVLITVLLSPLWIIAGAVFIAPFIVMFACEVALTMAFILLLAGCCALGTAASLTGIIYGIIKMFTVPSVGLYEIGFGIIIAGVSMICGILIYNGAVRFMPWLFRKSGHLFKFTFKKVKPLLAKYRRWLVK